MSSGAQVVLPQMRRPPMGSMPSALPHVRHTSVRSSLPSSCSPMMLARPSSWAVSFSSPAAARRWSIAGCCVGVGAFGSGSPSGVRGAAGCAEHAVRLLRQQLLGQTVHRVTSLGHLGHQHCQVQVQGSPVQGCLVQGCLVHSTMNRSCTGHQWGRVHVGRSNYHGSRTINLARGRHPCALQPAHAPRLQLRRSLQ